MNNLRQGFSSCVLNGYIYAMGGSVPSSRWHFLGSTLRTAERFSLKDRQWEILADMNENRSYASCCSCDIRSRYIYPFIAVCVVKNFRIYCAGGNNGLEALFTAEFYCPENKIWTQIKPMTSRRFGLSIISHNGDVFAVGGFDGTNELKTSEVRPPHNTTC